jgi:hypothetical protein
MGFKLLFLGFGQILYTGMVRAAYMVTHSTTPMPETHGIQKVESRERESAPTASSSREREREREREERDMLLTTCMYYSHLPVKPAPVMSAYQ